MGERGGPLDGKIPELNTLSRWLGFQDGQVVQAHESSIHQECPPVWWWSGERDGPCDSKGQKWDQYLGIPVGRNGKKVKKKSLTVKIN